MDWQHHASFSRFHPDNLNKLPLGLPEAVKGPAPTAKFSEIDKKVYGAWGHTLSCEKAYGPMETTTRIKETITPKVGGSWRTTEQFEKGTSISQSSVYGGSCARPPSRVRGGERRRPRTAPIAPPPLSRVRLADLEPSFEMLVEMKNKKG